MSDLGAERRAAARLFGRTGVSVPERISGIEHRASRLLRLLKGRRPKAATARWAFRQLRTCAVVFREPPPVSLIDLIELVACISSVARDQVRRRDKWAEAAQHKAEHPGATARQIASAIAYDQHAVISRWMKSPDWRRAVERNRQRVREIPLLPADDF